jgi:hypothetical protein
MPAYATGMRPGKRLAVLGSPTRYQRRVYAKPGGLQVADWVMSGSVQFQGGVKRTPLPNLQK